MTEANQQVEVSEAEIAVHWPEEELIQPGARFVAQANMADPEVLKRFSEENFPECFREYADLLTWDRDWHTTLDTSDPPFWKWFLGGRLNACYNCVDRHLARFKNKAAFVWVPEPEEERDNVVTYQELFVRVNEFAALLRDFAGLKTGDRVTFHLPMTPELPVSMLACARLGVVHSQVFGGFSGVACGDRIVDSGSHILVTIDAYWRNGRLLDHKASADQAVEQAERNGVKVDKVLVWKRYPDKYSSPTPMVEGRDYFVDELLEEYRGKRVDPVSMPAEAPLFLMYTSGTTAKPKGCQHSTGGYLSYVAGTSKFYQDIHPEDTYWCFADIGWITGHSYIVYGPLAVGATSIMYEGVPTYPDAGRPWRIAERLGVDIFHTAPTTIRMLRKAGPDEPQKYNYRFKHMTTVGEPIEPDVWKWYYQVVGKNEAVIVDTWWQTETGGFIGTTLPGLQPMKPGSCGPGALGIYPVIYDEKRNEVEPGTGGNICIRNPWPGFMQTIWGDPERFIDTYFRKYCKDPESKDWRDWPYLTGDGATRAKDGYFRIVGRVDDVINVAGHRLGTKELESAVLTVEAVGEAAAVPAYDELKGRVPEIYISLKPGFQPGPQLVEETRMAVSRIIGPIARPSQVWVTEDLPKTRSGKIMRRVIAAISNFMDVGDTTTLANPEVVEEIRKQVQSAKVKQGVVPREIPKELEEELRRFGEEG